MTLGFGGQQTVHQQVPKVFVALSLHGPVSGRWEGVGPTATGGAETGTR